MNKVLRPALALLALGLAAAPLQTAGAQSYVSYTQKCAANEDCLAGFTITYGDLKLGAAVRVGAGELIDRLEKSDDNLLFDFGLGSRGEAGFLVPSTWSVDGRASAQALSLTFPVRDEFYQFYYFASGYVAVYYPYSKTAKNDTNFWLFDLRNRRVTTSYTSFS